MFTVDSIDRLIEVRFSGTLPVAETIAFRSALTGHFVKSAEKFVICVDLRDCAPFDETVKSMLLGLMRSDNPRVERAAYLTLPTGANRGMVKEILDTLATPMRRHFDDAKALVTWLGDGHDAAMSARLKTFLGEQPPAR